jgi:hypothetical protein
MLAPDFGASWKDLNYADVLVDTAVLVSLPLVVALVGGVIFSVRLSTRRIVVAVAVIAILLGGLTAVARRIRRFDHLAYLHRSQMSGLMIGFRRPDGTTTMLPANVDAAGKPLTPQQERMDHWHWEMAERYQRATHFPWAEVTVDPPPDE